MDSFQSKKVALWSWKRGIGIGWRYIGLQSRKLYCCKTNTEEIMRIDGTLCKNEIFYLCKNACRRKFHNHVSKKKNKKSVQNPEKWIFLSFSLSGY